MGLADVRAIREGAVEEPLTQALIPKLVELMKSLETQASRELISNETNNEEEIIQKVHLKYEGTNSTLTVNFADNVAVMRQEFEGEHKSRYGFIQLEKNLIVESASVEVILKMETLEEPLLVRTRSTEQAPSSVETVQMFAAQQWHDTPVYRREHLEPGDCIIGPAIVVEQISTIVVEPNWEARLTECNHLILERR